jgi:hypothetical protein
MPSPDTLIEAGSFAVLAVLLLSLRLIRPIGSPRPRHSAGWLDAHQVAVEARHYLPASAAPAVQAALPPAAPPSVPDTIPWVVPDVPATRPDALKTVRTV